MTASEPTSLADRREAFRPHAQGVPYVEFIGRLTRELRARSYLEIGTWNGASLAAVGCPSIAIDPTFALTHDVVGRKESCLLFQMPSDDFFRRYDVRTLFSSGLDVAFLDGMHLFEFLLRDFMNVEKACRSNSIVLMHDCLPPSPEIAMRTRAVGEGPGGATKRAIEPTPPEWWTGDVWKVVPILREFRPDLVVHCLDCPPTGLVLVTHLDPENSILQHRYFDIVARYSDAEHEPGWFDDLYDSVPLRSSQEFLTPSNVTKYVWL